MQVVMIETFAGTDGRLGRSAIVEVEQENLLDNLQNYRYTEIREFTPGAVKSELAKRNALQLAPKNMDVYYGGLFKVRKIR